MKTLMTSDNTRVKDPPRTYRGLCERYLPRPIKDENDHAAALAVIEPLIGFEASLTVDQSDYLEAVSTFIEQYEQAHVKWPRTKPETLLKHLVKEHEMSGADLARLLGVDVSLGSKILRGERRLTVEHIRILSKHFAVSPELFVG